MSEFVMVTPAYARHKDGWIVGGGERSSIEYRDEGGRSGQMAVERGLSSYTIYPETLRWLAPEARDATSEEQHAAAQRISAALNFMGKDVLTHSGPA